VDVKVSDSMPDGGKVWLEWHRRVHPQNRAEIESLEADAGRYIGYTRTIGQRRAGVQPDEFCWPGADTPASPVRSAPDSCL
jgi:hypothetical protein